MTLATLGMQRLWQQRLVGRPFGTPAAVVGWLGAVQSQEYLGAAWSLGMRLAEATEDAIEQAFTSGAILRTHVMRPTWHFVTPEDIGWLLELTASRIKATLAYYGRQLAIDDALLPRSNAVIARALEGGHFRTRAELAVDLAANGIAAEGQRLGHLVMSAELDAVICSGPRRGKQFTYALLAERAPNARTLSREEALSELTRRYFTSHGPATARDFSWWSGLTLADAREGLALAGEALTSAEIDGQTYWFPPSLADAVADGAADTTAFLLPTYDEYLVGYSGFGASLTGGRGNPERNQFTAAVVFGGRVIGNWRRTLSKQMATVEVAPFEPLSARERDAIFAAAQRYGAFLGLAVECVGV
jgi:DNA glycosylase AlkZ-like